MAMHAGGHTGKEEESPDDKSVIFEEYGSQLGAALAVYMRRLPHERSNEKPHNSGQYENQHPEASSCRCLLFSYTFSSS